MSRMRPASYPRPIGISSRTATGGGQNGKGIQNRDRAPRAQKWQVTAVRVLALSAFVLVAVLIVADTAGQNMASSDPDGALVLAPWEPVALDELAQRQMSTEELSSAQALARRALLSDPLDSRALSLLGLMAERNSDLARAEALMSLAAARSWRNPAAHVWLLAQAIRAGKFEEALVHADGLLRVNPRYAATIFPILALFGLEPRGLAALEGALAANPPWRRSFLGEAVVKGANDRLMTQLYQSLIRGSQPPTSLEMKPYLDRLIQMGRFAEAYEAWRATSSQGNTAVRYPYNGNFEVPLDGSPFNWVFDFVSGTEIQITEAPDRDSSHALRVQFSGARAWLGRVGQLLMLSPGSYRLELAIKASALRTERGLVWQVSCAESRLVLAETHPMMGTTPWADLKVKFSVPSSGCSAQWLNLLIPARTASETEIEGEVWFKNFRITAEALAQ
jgi:tetratricopeptide (TPR) repeat protein